VRLLEKLPAAVLRSSGLAEVKKLRRLAYLSIPGPKGKYLFLRGHFIPSEIAKHLNVSESEVWKILEEQPALENIDHLSSGNQASWIEMNLYMQNQLLRDSDVMSMAHGVEIRVPFLDKEFVTLSLQIQSAVKYQGKFKKQLLIDSFKEMLPEPVYDRPKMGFSFPFKEWLAKNDFVKEKINTSDNSARSHYKKFLAGEIHWSQLMTMLLLQNKYNA
jgi:asparagine synthase (glutamine-hydrolysing)